jgi:hypothetical protein
MKNRYRLVRDSGDELKALVLADRVIAIFEGLDKSERRSRWADHLATAYLDRAAGIAALGDYADAVALCDRAMTLA